MKEIPILFSAPMVQAILAGQKTQTRRVVTVPWKGSRRAPPYAPYYVEEDGKLLVDCSEARDSHGSGDYREITTVMARYGRVGDVLWVKETFCDDYGGDPAYPPGKRVRDLEDGSVEGVLYRASHDCRSFEAGCPCNSEGDGKRSDWRSPLHMPRWASRLTLQVTGVRVERLQAITADDARAEGIDPSEPVNATVKGKTTALHVFGADAPQRIYRMLWESLHGLRHPWEDNPWVWVIAFRRACPRCKGQGFVSHGCFEADCPECAGTGKPGARAKVRTA